MLRAKIAGNWTPIGIPNGGAVGDVLIKSGTPSDWVTRWGYDPTKLYLTSTVTADLVSTTHPLTLGLVSSTNLALGNARIQARNNGVASTLNLNPLGGSVNVGGTLGVTASATSDLALIIGASAGMGNNEGGQMRWLGAPTQANFDIDNYNGTMRVLMAGAPGGVGLNLSAAGFLTVSGIQNNGGLNVTGLTQMTGGGEGLRMTAASMYQSWYNGGTRIGYLQGNSGQIYLNGEAAGVSLRLRGAGGCFLDNGVNNYQVSESVIGTRVVCTNPSGYIYGNYINMTADTTGDVPIFAGQNGDNFMRWYNSVNANKISWNGAVNATLRSLALAADLTTFVAEADCYDATGRKEWNMSQARVQSLSGRTTPVCNMAFWIQQANAAPILGAFSASGEALRCVNNPNTAHIPILASAFTVSSSRDIKEHIEDVVMDSLLDRLASVPIHRFRYLIPPQRLRLKADYEPTFAEDDKEKATPLPPPAEAYESHDHDCAIDPCEGTHSDNDPCPEMFGGRMRYGFMAEDLHEAFPELAPLGDHRRPEGIDVSQVSMVALAGVAALLKRVKALESR